MHIGIQYRDFGSEEESLHGKRMKRHVLILLQFKRHAYMIVDLAYHVKNARSTILYSYNFKHFLFIPSTVISWFIFMDSTQPQNS